MPFKYLLLWIGSIGVFPTLYYVISQKRDLSKNKKILIGIIFLSFYTFVFFGLILKIHLNIRYLPTSVKF